MDLKVGNLYLVVNLEEGDYHTLKILKLGVSNPHQIKAKVVASNYYNEGETFWFGTDECWFESCSCTLVKGEQPEIVIDMADKQLKDLFIDLALQTNDKEWFMELTGEGIQCSNQIPTE